MRLHDKWSEIADCVCVEETWHAASLHAPTHPDNLKNPINPGSRQLRRTNHAFIFAHKARGASFARKTQFAALGQNMG